MLYILSSFLNFLESGQIQVIVGVVLTFHIYFGEILFFICSNLLGFGDLVGSTVVDPVSR
jgi:hypothetical protein